MHTQHRYTHQHTRMELHPHKYLFAQICPRSYTHTCTVGVYAHRLTPKFESHGGRSQQRAQYCQMVCVMCVITSLVFLICDAALRACVCACVFICAYMCGRLVLPCFFFFWVFSTSATVGSLPEPQAKDLVYQQPWLCRQKKKQKSIRLDFSLSQSVD